MRRCARNMQQPSECTYFVIDRLKIFRKSELRRTETAGPDSVVLDVFGFLYVSQPQAVALLIEKATGAVGNWVAGMRD